MAVAKKIELNEKSRTVLKKLSNSRQAGSHLRERATIILLCDERKTNPEISAALEISKNTVSKWRTRWKEHENKIKNSDTEGIAYQREIEKVLNDNPRSGTPPKFTPEQNCQIQAIACEIPEDSGQSFTSWTLKSIAEEAVKRGIVKSISRYTVHVFLKDGRP